MKEQFHLPASMTLKMFTAGFEKKSFQLSPQRVYLPKKRADFVKGYYDKGTDVLKYEEYVAICYKECV